MNLKCPILLYYPDFDVYATLFNPYFFTVSSASTCIYESRENTSVDLKNNKCYSVNYIDSDEWNLNHTQMLTTGTHE